LAVISAVTPAQSSIIRTSAGCAALAGERGWRAYLTTDEDEPFETVFYCPDRAAREFGAPPGQPSRI
jgi:hypothetical protein